MISSTPFSPRRPATAFMSSLENALERLLRFPLRVLRSQRLHPVERKCELKVNRLLGPERAVVVERRDSFWRGYEVSTALRRDACHEADDGLLRRSVVPGGEGIGGGSWRWRHARCLHRRRLAAARRRGSQNAEEDDGKERSSHRLLSPVLERYQVQKAERRHEFAASFVEGDGERTRRRPFSVASATGHVGHLRHGIVDGERVGLLYRRKVLEGVGKL